MNNHLAHTVLNSLADGALSPEELTAAQLHLDVCPVCTSKALGQALLKTAVAKSGHRYAPSPDFTNRLRQLVSSEPKYVEPPQSTVLPSPHPRWARGWTFAGWALAAVLLLVSVVVVQRNPPWAPRTTSHNIALATEICDLHVASLASDATAQVISTDRHTVKPWFQGKIPFAFNLPEGLPADVKLDGANLIYVEGQPAAQLFYSIGHHRVSVFLRERRGSKATDSLPQERSGFHLVGFNTAELEVSAISDVDPARLSALMGIIEGAQNKSNPM